MGGHEELGVEGGGGGRVGQDVGEGLDSLLPARTSAFLHHGRAKGEKKGSKGSTGRRGISPWEWLRVLESYTRTWKASIGR